MSSPEAVLSANGPVAAASTRKRSHAAMNINEGTTVARADGNQGEPDVNPPKKRARAGGKREGQTKANTGKASSTSRQKRK